MAYSYGRNILKNEKASRLSQDKKELSATKVAIYHNFWRSNIMLNSLEFLLPQANRPTFVQIKASSGGHIVHRIWGGFQSRRNSSASIRQQRKRDHFRPDSSVLSQRTSGANQRGARGNISKRANAFKLEPALKCRPRSRSRF